MNINLFIFGTAICAVIASIIDRSINTFTMGMMIAFFAINQYEINKIKEEK